MQGEVVGGLEGEAGRKVCFHGGKISKVSLTTAAHKCVSSERPSRAETATYAHTCRQEDHQENGERLFFPPHCIKKTLFFPSSLHIQTQRMYTKPFRLIRGFVRGVRESGGSEGGSLDDVSPPTSPFDSWM